MSVRWIKAQIECDECGTRFQVELEESSITPEDWTLFELVEDVVRGGIGGDNPLKGSSVQEGKMLCSNCTEKADKKNETKR